MINYKHFICAGKKFRFQSEAVAYANWLFKVSGLIVAVEGVQA